MIERMLQSKIWEMPRDDRTGMKTTEDLCSRGRIELRGNEEIGGLLTLSLRGAEECP